VFRAPAAASRSVQDRLGRVDRGLRSLSSSGGWGGGRPVAYPGAREDHEQEGASLLPCKDFGEPKSWV